MGLCCSLGVTVCCESFRASRSLASNNGLLQMSICCSTRLSVHYRTSAAEWHLPLIQLLALASCGCCQRARFTCIRPSEPIQATTCVSHRTRRDYSSAAPLTSTSAAVADVSAISCRLLGSPLPSGSHLPLSRRPAGRFAGQRSLFRRRSCGHRNGRLRGS